MLSGDAAYIEDLQRQLEKQGIFSRLVSSSDYASHSPQLEVIRDALESSLIGLQPNETQIPFLSTVTGTKKTGKQLAATYWYDNICKPVRFHTAIDNLLQQGQQLFLEISPHPVLSYSIHETAKKHDKAIAVLPSLEKGKQEQLALLTTMAMLYTHGLDITWSTGSSRVSLPTYAWNRQSYWFENLSKERIQRLKKNNYQRKQQKIMLQK